jgi:hypothetical protein
MSGRMGQVSRRGPARGDLDGNRRSRVAIKFEDEQFDDIRRLAVARKTSFAHQVRLLVAEGLKHKAGREAA